MKAQKGSGQVSFETDTPHVRPNRRRILLTLCALAAVLMAAATSLAPRAHAGNGGSGSLCSLSGITVKYYPNDGYVEYVYEVDCPGQPLGWFGGNATAKYEVFGNWDWQTMLVHDNVFSFDRNEGVFETMNCSDDPWTTAADYPGQSGFPSGHICTLQSRSGGDDWGTDTNPSGNFGDAMCFNDPWGASLAGCWSNGDLSVTGPSAALLVAYYAAQAEAYAPTPAPSPSATPEPFPIHLPQPIHIPFDTTPTPSSGSARAGEPVATQSPSSTAAVTATPSPTPSPTPSTQPRERPRP
jgi:hypothetical protein